MKVLHVVSTFYPDTKGGIEEVIRQICINSKFNGVESRVFTLSSNASPKIIQSEGFKIIRAKNSFTILSCRFSLSAISIFKEQVDWADIIHYHYPWPFADFLHYFAQVNKKSIMTYHADIVRQKYTYLLYRPLMILFLNSMDKIISTSINYNNSSPILKMYKDKLVTIPIGLDEKSYPITSESEMSSVKNIVGKDFFLFIGVFRFYKGLEILLKSMQGISANLVIAGKGPLERKLKRLANKLGLTNVHFVGEVTEVEKVVLLKLCRAVVFSSNLRSEAFGVSLVEGSIYKKPLITTDIGTGTSFVNIDGKTGLVVAPNDFISLRKAIVKISSDQYLSKKMGQSSRLRFEEFFKGKLMGQKYSDLYKLL